MIGKGMNGNGNENRKRFLCHSFPANSACWVQCGPKAVLKTRAVQTLRDCRASSNCAKRLECGAFTAAFSGCWAGPRRMFSRNAGQTSNQGNTVLSGG